MSRPFRSDATDNTPGKVLVFPAMAPQLAHVVQLSALPLGSAANLILTFTGLLTLVVRMADSLSEDMRLTFVGEALTLDTKLRETQAWLERHQSFLSDLSAKQARKRRRRQRRVKEDVELTA